MNVKEYWENENVISMSDKRVSNLESEIIKSYVKKTDNLLNIGCGDGSGCHLYRDKCKSYLGIERSKEMVKRFKKISSLPILNYDILKTKNIGKFSCIVTQRCLINLETKKNQLKIIKKIVKWLKPKGRLIVCEAFEEGLKNLNEMRKDVNLKPIIPHWHAKYLNDKMFNLKSIKLIEEKDLSGYFLLTRVLHAALEENPSTNSKINEIAEILQMKNKYVQKIKDISFIKIKVFEKC